MKRQVITLCLLLTAVFAGAQENVGLKKGFIHTAGIGAAYKINDHADVFPELGVGYRVNAKNAFGIAGQLDCVVLKANLFLFHTYDFLSKPSSPYIEYKAGVYDLMSRPGWLLGVQGGYRFSVAKKIPLRIGLTVDVNQITLLVDGGRKTEKVSIGLVLKTEF